MRSPTSLLLPLLPLALPQLAQAKINWDIFEYGVVPSFKWSRPFPDDGTDPMGFTVHCRHSKTFHAKMYKLKDLSEEPPTGLAPWKVGIEDFLRKRDYVGSWDGVDHKGQDREIVVMEWVDVPWEVKGWIEEQQRDPNQTNEKKWLFGVFEKPRSPGEKVFRTAPLKPLPTGSTSSDQQQQDRKQDQQNQQQQGKQQEQQQGQQQGQEQKREAAQNERDIPDEEKILVFPAGAIYEILPLWVAGGSGCERDLNNLTIYRSQGIEHSVLAWPVDHTKPQRDLGKRDITFKIEAMSVTETEDAKRTRLMWERMHRTIKRNERKQQREKRQKAKKELEEQRVRDEL
ncbi:hypothetical protein VTH82DRAFT_417 [Thermothelomyces myriococcoides]